MALGALGIIFMCIWKGRTRWLGFVAVIPAVVQPYLSAPPDILVDDTARLFAVSDTSGRVILKPGRTERFTREAWIDRYGASDQKWPVSGEGEAVLGLSCDSEGCIVVRHGQRVLVAFTAAALAEDCNSATFIVSVVPTRDFCEEPSVDLFALRREGVHAIWLKQDGVHKRSVADSTGNRVWMRGVETDERE